MLRTTWNISAVTGNPVVGAYVSSSVDGAWNAIEAAFFNAVGPGWGPIHTESLRGLETVLRRDAQAALSRGSQWDYSSPGVTVSMTRA
jgi:hypothetical protein